MSVIKLGAVGWQRVLVVLATFTLAARVTAWVIPDTVAVTPTPTPQTQTVPQAPSPSQGQTPRPSPVSTPSASHSIDIPNTPGGVITSNGPLPSAPVPVPPAPTVPPVVTPPPVIPTLPPLPTVLPTPTCVPLPPCVNTDVVCICLDVPGLTH